MYYQIYVDRGREHRWRMIADNGRIIACSGEGYKKAKDCFRILNRIRGKNLLVPIRTVDGEPYRKGK